MRKLTILIDMDDTIELLAKAWVAFLNDRYGTSVTPETLSDWEVWKFFPGLSKDEVYAPLYEDEFWDWVEPMEGASDYIQKIMDDGHKVLIVTASTYHTLKPKMEKVLFKYFPYFSWHDVIVTYQKQLIKGDVLVDDGPHNLIGADCCKILMDSPHNRKFDAESNGIIRVKNWSEVYSEIKNIAEAE